jgi:arsenite methyltransferase
LLDYASRLWLDAGPLAGYGIDTGRALASLRAMLAGVSEEDEDLVAWIRRDVPAPATEPEAVYACLAAGGGGEPVFASGGAALSRAGYGALADGVDPWMASRFAGLGCPWRSGLPRPGETVVDLGCGAGVDVAIAARAVGRDGLALGVDSRSSLRPAAGVACFGARFMLAPADATTLADGFATMVIANGLPPLMAPRTAPAVFREAHRILTPGGRLRAVVLVTGPDRAVEALDDVTIVNAVRCGKPLCARIVGLAVDASFVDVRLRFLASPFVAGFRPGPVAAVLLEARRP